MKSYSTLSERVFPDFPCLHEIGFLMAFGEFLFTAQHLDERRVKPHLPPRRSFL